MFAGYHGMVGYTLNILYLNLIYSINNLAYKIFLNKIR